jgi:hypothetical protein
MTSTEQFYRRKKRGKWYTTAKASCEYLTFYSPVITGVCITRFNIRQFSVLPTLCIYVFCMDLRTNSDYFPIQHQLIGFYNRGLTLQSPVVTICKASLAFSNSTFCPHGVFMCFVWILEQTAIISLYNINWLVFIAETKCLLRGASWSFKLIQVNLGSNALISVAQDYSHHNKPINHQLLFHTARTQLTAAKRRWYEYFWRTASVQTWAILMLINWHTL